MHAGAWWYQGIGPAGAASQTVTGVALTTTPTLPAGTVNNQEIPSLIMAQYRPA